MTLHLNTVSDLLWSSLNRLMSLKEFNSFRLVGGTSLSLQLGHRESIDIDLFTDAEYGSIDFDNLESTLTNTFPYVDTSSVGEVGMGKSYFIGNNENELVKLDLFYTDSFVFPCVVEKNIRFSSIEEIAAMKFEVIAQGGRKKDFWDVHELLETYTLDEMVGFYIKRYPYGYSKSELLTQIVDFSDAEDDFTPNCYKGKVWELIKLDFEDLIESWYCVSQLAKYTLKRLTINFKDRFSMPKLLHPLVQKTKVELIKLDKKTNISIKEYQKYNSAFLPISVEPKLRSRAFRFMSNLINLLEANNHNIKFYLNRCHVEMYGQLTEINLRQKYFRKRIKDSAGYGTDTYEKSNKLEFQIGSYARKGWIDRETKKLEDYLPAIYEHIEKKSKEWAELRIRQRIEEEKREVQRKLDEEKARQDAIEKAKLEKLISDAGNYKKASEIRSYLQALQERLKGNGKLTPERKEWLNWANGKADWYDPLVEKADELFKEMDTL